jgi:hypothetical protein
VAGVGLPLFANAADARRTQDAAQFLAGQFRLARQRAVMSSRHVAVVFDEAGAEVLWRLCEDGDRDGLSRADVVANIDRCEAPQQPLSSRFPGVTVGYAPGVPSPDDEVGVAALRFGASQMAVFTPAGTATAGTVALIGPGENQFAVRVSSVTGRSRVLRFNRGDREWVE